MERQVERRSSLDLRLDLFIAHRAHNPTQPNPPTGWVGLWALGPNGGPFIGFTAVHSLPAHQPTRNPMDLTGFLLSQHVLWPIHFYCEQASS